MFSLYDLAEVVAAFAAFFTMLFVLVRRPRHVSAQLFIFAALLSLLFWTAFVALVPNAPTSGWQHGLLAAFLCLGMALWLLFLLAFARETPSASPRSWSFPVWLVIGLLIAAAGAGFFLRFFSLEALESGETVFLVERMGQYLLGLVIIAASFAFLQVENTFRASTGSMRRALIVPVLALTALLVVVVISASLGLLYGYIRFASVQLSAALLALMLVVVSRFLVFEERTRQRVVLSRQAIYSSVGVLLVGAYLIIVGIAIKLLTSLGGNPSVFFSVVAAFIVVVIFLALLLSGSLKARLRGFIDRTFLSGRIDLSSELAAFADDVTATVDKKKMFAITARVLEEKCDLQDIRIYQRAERIGQFFAVYPAGGDDPDPLPGIESWLLRSTRLAAAVDVLVSLAEPRRAEREFLDYWNDGYFVPLLARQELVGFLVCRSRSRLGSDAVLLIETISHQLALSLLSARQYETLVETKELASFHKVSSFVIHDVKNLISMVSMILQNAEKKFDDPRFQQTTIETLDSAQRRMRRMIGRLAAPQEQADFPIGDCDLGRLVVDLIAEMKLAGNRKLELVVSLEGVSTVRGNPERVKSIIGNLFINAIEAMPDGGHLRILADEDNESVLLSVEDSGVGMSEEFLRERLFRPFHTSKPNGLGIGLFQSREVARQMGGELSASSQPGSGSVFKLRLRKS